jgi:hypothetical protein
MLDYMKKHLRTLIVGVSALIALGTISACSGGTSTEATKASEAPTTTAAAETPKAFPQLARYIADMKAPDGKPMVIGISVEGNDVAAYACNGTDDEAWFFGKQADGNIDITSRFGDTLKADFDGKNLGGDLTVSGVHYKFDAAQVSDPAGMYTAELNGVRASWVVREDGSAIGVQKNKNDDNDVADVVIQEERDRQAQVKNRRLFQQAQQILQLQNRSARSTINGTEVLAGLVNGGFRF